MPAFNVLMLIPLDVSVIISSVALRNDSPGQPSLVLELNLLSGLYFISNPYCLADVDDIIQNTGGEGPFKFLVWLLPTTRDEIDEYSFPSSDQSTCLAFLIDFVMPSCLRGTGRLETILM